MGEAPLGLLSIVVPARDEAGSIVATLIALDEAVRTPHEVVVVDDHSQDGTAAAVEALARQRPAVRVVRNARPPGFSRALQAGVEAARGPAIVIVMADLSDDAAVVDAMWGMLSRGADLVCGSRYSRGGARLGGSRLKGGLSWGMGRVVRALTGLPTWDVANAFKMYRRGTLLSLTVRDLGFATSMDLALQAYAGGARVVEIPTVWRERSQGASKFLLLKMLWPYARCLWTACAVACATRRGRWRGGVETAGRRPVAGPL